MPRYTCAKPLFVESPLWDEQRERFTPDLSVPAPESIDTGLVTAAGTRIYRSPNPLGFGRDGDW